MRVALVCSLVLAVALAGCSSSDDPRPTATAPATSTAEPTATATFTPVPPPPAATSAPAQQQQSQPPAQQQQGPPPGQVACAVATSTEIQALNLLIQTRLAIATPAQAAAIRSAAALVDRNNDGAVDANVCRDAVVQATQLIGAVR